MKVLLTADAEKQFLKLPKPERGKIEKRLRLLRENPHAGKNSLVNMPSYDHCVPGHIGLSIPSPGRPPKRLLLSSQFSIGKVRINKLFREFRSTSFPNTARTMV